jgi:Fe-S cluster assembly ATP-binding protein
LPAWKRARLGLFLAPQDPIEVPGVSLAGVIGEALAARRSPAAAAAATTATSLAEATTLLAAAEKVLLAEAQKVGLDPTFLERAVNVELSGGERKRSEVLQLGVLTPAFAVLDELDSGLDVDGLRAVGKRVHESVSEWGAGVLAITHYRRLLSVIHPDAVHVLVEGRIVASGGAELAEELERTGYSAYTGVDAANQT